MEDQLMLPEPSIEALAEEMVKKQLKDYKVGLMAELISDKKQAEENYKSRLEYISERKKQVNNLTLIPSCYECRPCSLNVPDRC